MYYHVVRVGSRVDFLKNPAETPRALHDTIDKMQVYQGVGEQTGQAILFVFFAGYSNVGRIGLLRACVHSKANLLSKVLKCEMRTIVSAESVEIS